MDAQSPNEDQLRFIRNAIVPLVQSLPNHTDADIVVEVLRSIKPGTPSSGDPWFNVSVYINGAPHMSAARLPRCAHARSSNSA